MSLKSLVTPVLLMLAVAATPAVMAQTEQTVMETHSAANLPSVTRELIIHAPMQKVFDAIRARRTSSTKRTELSYKNSAAVVREQFPSCPIVGDISCTYEEDEKLPDRINYHMVSSNKFRAFEGCYHLRPAADGVSTVLSLTSTIDPGIRIPFWQDIARAAANKNVAETLHEIATLAGDQ